MKEMDDLMERHYAKSNKLTDNHLRHNYPVKCSVIFILGRNVEHLQTEQKASQDFLLNKHQRTSG